MLCSLPWNLFHTWVTSRKPDSDSWFLFKLQVCLFNCLPWYHLLNFSKTPETQYTLKLNSIPTPQTNKPTYKLYKMILSQHFIPQLLICSYLSEKSRCHLWRLSFFYPSNPSPNLALSPKSLLNYSLFSPLPLPHSSDLSFTASCLDHCSSALTGPAASTLSPSSLFFIPYPEWSSSLISSDFPLFSG